MSDYEDVERLREAVVDERARRAYAEQQLLAERRRGEVWRTKLEEERKAHRRSRRSLRRIAGVVRRRSRPTREEPPSTQSEISAISDDKTHPYFPTLRIGAWKPPAWLPHGAECIDLSRDHDAVASADMVFVAGSGSLELLGEWLTLPARQSLVLWDWGGAQAEGWDRHLTSRDIVVGSLQLGAARSLAPWPVAIPSHNFVPSKFGGDRLGLATPDTPLNEIVAQALMRNPMQWYQADPPGELDNLVVGKAVDRRKAGVLSRLAAAERFAPRRAVELLAREVGISLPASLPSVGILLVTRWPDRLGGALEQIAGLRYPQVDVVVGLHGVEASKRIHAVVDSSGIDGRVSLLEFDEQLSLGECLNRSAEATASSILAKFDDDDRYGRWYLDEAVDALTNTDAELVGKATQHVYLSTSDQLVLHHPGKEDSEVGYVSGPTFVMPRSTWEQVRFPHRRSRVDSIFVRGLKAIGGTIWSTSKYEFLLGRRADGHTWEVSDERFLANSDVVGNKSDVHSVWLDDQAEENAAESPT